MFLAGNRRARRAPEAIGVASPEAVVHAFGDPKTWLEGAGALKTAFDSIRLGFCERGAQNRGKECHLVDARRQLSDELFQAVVQ
jgi:hypothetical protein